MRYFQLSLSPLLRGPAQVQENIAAKLYKKNLAAFAEMPTLLIFTTTA